MRNWIDICESNIPSESDMDELCQGINDETGAHLEAHMLDDAIHIEYIEGGGGRGWEAIRQLCDFADANGFDIVLSVLDGAPGLVKYYLRHGFEVDYMEQSEIPHWLAGYEATYDFDDFATHEEIPMTRKPGTLARP